MTLLMNFAHAVAQNPAFYMAAIIAVFASFFTVTGRNPVHALLYLIVSLLSLAVIFFLLGAPFAALLEVIVYAGAILVLFVFVVMMLNLGDASEQEARWLAPRIWVGPMVLSALLLTEIFVLMFRGGVGSVVDPSHAMTLEVTAKTVGVALYGPYLLAVELASMLLLGALVAAYHLARNE
jgi:NADH-quinone oxidoreductase subunit J